MSSQDRDRSEVYMRRAREALAKLSDREDAAVLAETIVDSLLAAALVEIRIALYPRGQA